MSIYDNVRLYIHQTTDEIQIQIQQKSWIKNWIQSKSKIQHSQSKSKFKHPKLTSFSAFVKAQSSDPVWFAFWLHLAPPLPAPLSNVTIIFMRWKYGTVEYKISCCNIIEPVSDFKLWGLWKTQIQLKFAMCEILAPWMNQNNL